VSRRRRRSIHDKFQSPYIPISLLIQKSYEWMPMPPLQECCQFFDI
jgi:hypothetical protein